MRSIRSMRAVGIALSLGFVVANRASVDDLLQGYPQAVGFAEIDGKSWESGGWPPSNPGDEAWFVGTIGEIHPYLPGNPLEHSYTWFIEGGISLGEEQFGAIRIWHYGGTQLTIFEDALPGNESYGTDPPNATCPSTFTDGGTAYLEAVGSDFLQVFNSSMMQGSATCQFDILGGTASKEALDFFGPCMELGLRASAEERIEGFDLRYYDGVIVSGGCGLAVESHTWGSIKALYR